MKSSGGFRIARRALAHVNAQFRLGCVLGALAAGMGLCRGRMTVVDLANGQNIASCAWETRDNCNCADPVIAGGAIFVTSAYGVGCALISVSGGNAAVIWKNKLACHYANPVLVGNCLYALFSTGWLKADLVCVNVKDGAVRWTQKDVGSGGLMVADGKLLVLSRGGGLILAEASSTAYTELARAKTSLADPCWNSPVLCDGRIYARNEKGTLVCLDVRGK